MKSSFNRCGFGSIENLINQIQVNSIQKNPNLAYQMDIKQNWTSNSSISARCIVYPYFIWVSIGVSHFALKLYNTLVIVLSLSLSVTLYLSLSLSLSLWKMRLRLHEVLKRFTLFWKCKIISSDFTFWIKRSQVWTCYTIFSGSRFFIRLRTWK